MPAHKSRFNKACLHTSQSSTKRACTQVTFQYHRACQFVTQVTNLVPLTPLSVNIAKLTNFQLSVHVMAGHHTERPCTTVKAQHHQTCLDTSQSSVPQSVPAHQSSFSTTGRAYERMMAEHHKACLHMSHGLQHHIAYLHTSHGLAPTADALQQMPACGAPVVALCHAHTHHHKAVWSFVGTPGMHITHCVHYKWLGAMMGPKGPAFCHVQSCCAVKWAPPLGVMSQLTASMWG